MQSDNKKTAVGKYGIELDDFALSLLKEVEGDPTLEDCVCRDIWELQKTKKLQKQFQKCAIDKQKQNIIQENNMFKFQSQVEEDEELQQIRNQRLRELKFNTQNTNQNLQQVHEGQYLKRLIKYTAKLLVIVSSSNRLDFQIRNMTNPWRDLVVARVDKDIALKTCGQFLQERQFTAETILGLCFLNHKFVKLLELNEFENDWLSIQNVILNTLQLGQGQDEPDGELEDEWNKPCEQCGRTFPHEHIQDYRIQEESEEEGQDEESC
eukprot:TRINITY_DN44886_c0_g1_i1.p1 TRINITY_DN44886_c0_g1~~TRINITY_DN44886_c0_g1_i1.p1  ORF type:complete len:266 (-),score=32.09 TRINITY_DN44886_c0_g1_i1:140-937(-)